jgi:tRNA threonylcarbamoyladenosine biosynthesis protein TsaE
VPGIRANVLATMMEARTWNIESVEAMEKLGEQLGQEMSKSMVIALVGPLGAGKTHLTKGIARGLGFVGEVTSPTFSLVQEYHGGRLPLFHFDLYRLKSSAEVIAMGWDDFHDQRGVILAEWGDLFPELFDDDDRLIRIIVCEKGRKVLYC